MNAVNLRTTKIYSPLERNRKIKTSNLISRLFIIIFDYNIQNIIIFDSTMITRRLDC